MKTEKETATEAIRPRIPDLTFALEVLEIALGEVLKEKHCPLFSLFPFQITRASYNPKKEYALQYAIMLLKWEASRCQQI